MNGHSGVMQITHFGHSCLLVEIDGTKVLFDPGNFSHGFDGIDDLDAILITHQHTYYSNQGILVINRSPGVVSPLV